MCQLIVKFKLGWSCIYLLYQFDSTEYIKLSIISITKNAIKPAFSVLFLILFELRISVKKLTSSQDYNWWIKIFVVSQVNAQVFALEFSKESYSTQIISIWYTSTLAMEFSKESYNTQILSIWCYSFAERILYSECSGSWCIKSFPRCLN